MAGMMKYSTSTHTHIILKHAFVPLCRLVLAHKAQSPSLLVFLANNREMQARLTVHCVVKEDGNWVSELREWLPNYSLLQLQLYICHGSTEEIARIAE